MIPDAAIPGLIAAVISLAVLAIIALGFVLFSIRDDDSQGPT